MENPNQILTEIKVILFSLQNHALHVLVHPNANTNAVNFPAQNIEHDSSLEENALTCLKEFLQADEIYLEQLYTYGDEFNAQGDRHISIVYYALLPHNKTDLSTNTVSWIPVQENNCFSVYENEMLQYALRRLRYKLEYSAVGFELLPENFSLSELQRTYEIILDEKLDKRNFRRRILQANIIEPTPYRKTGEGRPATLYQYRSDAVAEIKARRLFP